MLQGAVVVIGILEYFRIRPEGGLGSGTLSFPNHRQGSLGFASHILLAIEISVSAYFNFHLLGQSVYNGSTYTVKSSGNLISAASELTTCVKLGMDDFNAGHTVFLIDINRHTSSVIRYGDGAVVIYAYVNL